MRRRIFLVSFAAILTACTAAYQSDISNVDVVYYLVKHAKKTDEKKDPCLVIVDKECAKIYLRA